MVNVKKSQAYLIAPIGAFLIFEAYFFFDVASREDHQNFRGFFEASILILGLIYIVYSTGLIVLVPIISKLSAIGKLNLVTSSIVGSCFGTFMGVALYGIGKGWLVLGPIMGLASGALFWVLLPKSPESQETLQSDVESNKQSETVIDQDDKDKIA